MLPVILACLMSAAPAGRIPSTVHATIRPVVNAGAIAVPSSCTVASIGSEYIAGVKAAETVVLLCKGTDPAKPARVFKRIADASQFGRFDPSKKYTANFALIP